MVKRTSAAGQGCGSTAQRDGAGSACAVPRFSVWVRRRSSADGCVDGSTCLRRGCDTILNPFLSAGLHPAADRDTQRSGQAHGPGAPGPRPVAARPTRKLAARLIVRATRCKKVPAVLGALPGCLRASPRCRMGQGLVCFSACICNEQLGVLELGANKASPLSRPLYEWSKRGGIACLLKCGGDRWRRRSRVGVGPRAVGGRQRGRMRPGDSVNRAVQPAHDLRRETNRTGHCCGYPGGRPARTIILDDGVCFRSSATSRVLCARHLQSVVHPTHHRPRHTCSGRRLRA